MTTDDADVYEEYSLTAEKLAIDEGRMARIDAWFEEAGAWLDRLDAIRPTLDRLERGGRYAGIRFDQAACEIVFINHDATRFTRTPEQIARLFGLDQRPAAPALN